MSDTMEEGVLVAWSKKIGDTIAPGDVLAEVETDKATMELESYQAGTLIYIGVEPGAAVPVNGILAILGEKGEDVSEILAKEEAASATEEAPAKEETPAEPVSVAPSPTSIPAQTPVVAPAAAPVTADSNGRMKVSPLARKMASDSGIELSQVSGTGDHGRIVKRDIEAYLKSGGAAKSADAPAAQAAAPIVLPQIVGTESSRDVKNSQMRKVIAKRLGESKFGAPHFYLRMEINMDRAVESRKAMNAYSPVKISYNDMIIKAAAVALRKHPQVNASWLGDVIRYHDHIHIGMAVAVDEGLLVPVIRFVDAKALSHIAAETRELAGKARSRKLTPNEMQGNTFSISNLGMMDIEEFTAIINPPDACIMAVGTISKVPKFNENDEVVVRNVMKITLSCDHRVVDGAVGAAFMQTFKALMEEPMRLLV